MLPVLSEFGDSVLATGLVGGKLGEFGWHIDNQVKKISSIQEKLVTVSLFSRETTKQKFLKRSSIGTGRSRLFWNIPKLLESVEVVAISGSLPAGLPVDYYASLVELANQAGKPGLGFCSGAALSCSWITP